jgi:DNA-binding FrmR family transcriptional regulator
MQHASHVDIVKRLKRAEGHLRSVIGMIEAGRPCVDLAQQLHAVEAAVTNAKRELIQDHIEHCLEGGETAKADLKEIKQLARYL